MLGTTSNVSITPLGNDEQRMTDEERCKKWPYLDDWLGGRKISTGKVFDSSLAEKHEHDDRFDLKRFVDFNRDLAEQIEQRIAAKRSEFKQLKARPAQWKFWIAKLLRVLSFGKIIPVWPYCPAKMDRMLLAWRYKGKMLMCHGMPGTDCVVERMTKYDAQKIFFEF